MSFPPSIPLPWMQMRFGFIPIFIHNFDKTIHEPNVFFSHLWKKDEQLLQNKWQGNNLK